MLHHKKNQSGFALLMSLIVVSVVISIGLTLIDLTIKQLRLSSGSKDSESAFHAANGGAECIRFWRNSQMANFENGISVPVTCFGVAAAVNPNPAVETLASNIFKYTYEIPWEAGINRCSRVVMIIIKSDYSTTNTLNAVATHIPGYPSIPSPNKTCGIGGVCTIISVQGYSQVCSATTNAGTVQREVLLEL